VSVVINVNAGNTVVPCGIKGVKGTVSTLREPADQDPGAAALRELVMPVVVVAASEHDETSCATSTTSYVSLRPPILCVALAPASRTAQMVVRTGRFSVSVLAVGQVDLAQRAGRPATGPDKLAAVGIIAEQSPGLPGPPGVAGAAAVLWCEVSDVVTAGDHQVIFGRVAAFRGAVDDTGLLLRHHRRYLGTGQPITPPAADGYPI
jgi:3-hydroxy-9,10-secoandrosta-1,3,5(10)-triene-9,17-dione monooxygenase reductase component